VTAWVRAAVAVWALALVGVCSAWSSVARADAARMIAVHTDDVPSELAASAVEALAEVASASGARAPEDAARFGRLPAPVAEELVRIASGARAGLIVVLGRSGAKLRVVFRDGERAGQVSALTLTTGADSALSPRLRRRLVGAARRALRRVGGDDSAAGEAGETGETADDESSASSSAASELDDDDVGVGAAPAKAPRQAPRAAASSAASGLRTANPPVASTAAETSWASDSSEPRDAGATDERSDGDARVLSLHVVADAGVGTRKLAVPVPTGEKLLDAGTFPVLAVGLTAEAALGERWFVSAGAQLLTSIGLRTGEANFTTDGEVPVSSHNFTFGLAPGYRFGAAGAIDLRCFVGWTFRGLQGDDAMVSGAHLNGAVVRPQLQLALLDARLLLRLAPELILPMGGGASLWGQAVPVGGSGFGYGAEASISVGVAGPLYFDLALRVSRVALASGAPTDLTDRELAVYGGAVLRP